MEAEASTIPTHGTSANPGDNRVRWITNYEDAAPPRCAPACKTTWCTFCAFRNSNYLRAFGGMLSACSAFCACYVVYACFTRCARSMRFQNLTWNTLSYKSAPPAKNVQMIDKRIVVLISVSTGCNPKT